MGSTSSSEFQPLRTCPAHLVRSASLGVSFPFAASARGVHTERTSQVRSSFRPQRFSRSRRLTPPRPRGSISPRNHVRDSPFRGLVPPFSRRASSARRALLSLETFTYRRVNSAAPARAASPSGPSSEPRSEAAGGVISSPGSFDPLLGFNSLGLFSGHLGNAFTSPPLLTLTSGPCV